MLYYITSKPLQPRIKPRNRLNKTSLLRIGLLRDALIDPHREAVRRRIVQIRLECDIVRRQDALRARLGRRVERGIKSYTKSAYTLTPNTTSVRRTYFQQRC
jgi:hypothetical protein